MESQQSDHLLLDHRIAPMLEPHAVLEQRLKIVFAVLEQGLELPAIVPAWVEIAANGIDWCLVLTEPAPAPAASRQIEQDIGQRFEAVLAASVEMNRTDWHWARPVLVPPVARRLGLQLVRIEVVLAAAATGRESHFAVDMRRHSCCQKAVHQVGHSCCQIAEHWGTVCQIVVAIAVEVRFLASYCAMALVTVAWRGMAW